MNDTYGLTRVMCCLPVYVSVCHSVAVCMGVHLCVSVYGCVCMWHCFLLVLYLSYLATWLNAAP